ncbi:uncharacterized protein LOC127847913 [Dreissena polymorpha]|uniref:Sushi domain-containing protein n=1 Tax=Dreissena polymorpha TaxID=45954 RepID=A0A9D4DQJ2_DREPO|nr:uncharacterized protein LOC127847913 [Dreissena polymorpha]KAH3754022.1 hypothetical protein DPMN_188680 [Dreissena polymorpha]
MSPNGLILALYLSVCLEFTSGAHFTLVHHAKCFQGHELTTLVGVGLNECVTECALRASCQSVSYRRNIALCVLHDKIFTSEAEVSTSVVTCVGYVFVSVRLGPQLMTLLPGPCSSSPCPPGTRCMPFQDTFTCEFKECPSSTTTFVQGGGILGNLNSIGNFRLVKCDPEFKLFGVERQECLPTGNWSGETTCSMDCGPPPIVPNGFLAIGAIKTFTTEILKMTVYNSSQVTMTAVFLEGSYIEYACNNGFQMRENNFTECVNGLWIGDPTCEVPVSPTGAENMGNCNELVKSYSYSTGTCVKTCNTFADTFQGFPGKKLNFLDEAQLFTSNFTVCKLACLSRTDFKCSSFEISDSLCNLAIENANQGGYFRDASGWTYYQRDCIT